MSFAQSSHRQLFKVKGLETSDHVQIPGTRVHIIPPSDFQIASSFTGLKNGSSVIEVYDLPGGAYSTLSEDFTVEKFAQQGLQIISAEETRVDGFAARLITIRHNEQHAGLTVVFGDHTFSVIVVSNFSLQDPASLDQIKKSILGIRYGTGETNDGLHSAAFKLDNAKSAFHYDKRSANTFYYRKSNPADNSYFTVTQLSWDYSTTPSTIASLMLGEMKKYGLANPDVRKKSARKINGHRAFESEIYALRQGEKCLVYQAVVVHNSHAIVIHGFGNTDFRKNRQQFRKLAHSVRFK